MKAYVIVIVSWRIITVLLALYEQQWLKSGGVSGYQYGVA